MQNLFNEQKQKILSTLMVTVGAFLGFEAISFVFGLYQLKIGLYLSFYIYAFHIFWLTFLFDLHLKNRGVIANARLNHRGLKMVWEAFKDRCAHVRRWEYIRHYQNYLVLPGLIYWSTVVLLFLNPFKWQLKELIVISSTVALNVAYWYMKEHISRKLEARDHWIKVLAIVKLFAAFLVFSALVGTTQYFNFGSDFLLMSTLTVTFLLVYQALFQHNLLNFQIFLWIVIISLIMSAVSLWVFSSWNAEYFTAGLVMAAVYNMLWGVLHHHLDKTLTRQVVFEYLVMMVLILSFIFASHNFNQRVI